MLDFLAFLIVLILILIAIGAVGGLTALLITAGYSFYCKIKGKESWATKMTKRW